LLLYETEKYSYISLRLNRNGFLGYVICLDIDPSQILPTGNHYFHPAHLIFCFPFSDNGWTETTGKNPEKGYSNHHSQRGI
jgi:hypothetical protein